MEAFELKAIMAAYDTKLDNTLQLNKSILIELQLKNAQKSTNNILRYRIFEVVIFGFFALYFGWYTATNWGQTHLVISGIIVHFFALVALGGSIGQIVLLQQIDFLKPIVEIKKKMEQVNSHGLFFVKLVFLSAPVWWSYAIVGIDLFLDFDLFSHLEHDFVVRYVVINFLLIIPLVWFLNKLSYKNLHITWVSKTIRLFAGTKTMKAMACLNEIEEFEK